MSTDLRRRLRSYVVGLDVPRAIEVSEIIARAGARLGTARRIARRWRGPLATVAAVILLLLFVPLPQPWSGRQDRGERDQRSGEELSTPTLPDRIAGYSYLTGAVSESPPGRAIALYQHGMGVEFFDFQQAVVLGAGGDVYRRVDLAEDRAGPDSQGEPAPMLLSPDGRRVAVGSIADAGDLALLDLSTAAVVTRPARRDANILPLAWSPDGRYLAALEIVGDPGAFTGRPMHGPLVLYDVDSGAGPRRFTDFRNVYRVAFSPDGTEIAVQSTDAAGRSNGQQIPIIDLNGQRKRSLTPPAGYVLASYTAWSPDGHLIAVMNGPTMMFLDPSGAGRTVPAGVDASPDASSPVAWTGPDRLLLRVKNKNGDSDNILVEVNLTSGERRPITWIDTGPDDNYKPADFQLATGLLTQMRIRPAGPPDRGPWPQWIRTSIPIGIAGLAGLLVYLIQRTRHRYRRAPTRRRQQRPAAK